MGVTNLDALAANSLTVGGAAVVAGLSAISKGTTPASGWTTAGGANYCYKDVTVTGAATGDVVICTVNAPAMTGSAPITVSYVTGYVSAANTIRIFYTENSGGLNGGATTIAGTVSYILFRPS